MIVILNEVKNLIISTESIVGILRLMPQNDIATQPPKGREISYVLFTSVEKSEPAPHSIRGGGWGICRSSINLTVT